MKILLLIFAMQFTNNDFTKPLTDLRCLLEIPPCGLPSLFGRGNFMTEEIWKDIAGCEGFYWVSNLGRIKSNKVLRKPTTILGYSKIQLRKNGVLKLYFVHRLVAIAFIPNPLNKKEVNHIDFNKKNNCVENLEWMTHQENMNHAKLHKRNKGVSGILSHNFRTGVYQYGKDGKLINEFSSLKEASETCNICWQNLSRVCRGESYSAGSYLWSYEKHEVHPFSITGKRIRQVASEKPTWNLTPEFVLKVRALHDSGLSTYRIGKMLNKTQSTIWNITNRATWKHI